MLFKNTLIALILCAFFGYCKNEDAEDKTARTYGLVAMAQSSAATNASATCKNCHSQTV
ncbi:MAG: hypothetical protein KDK45_24750 [Leptospiraceae bacterium]|nr:hypothetical protein [Leptospiraceae bacterium]